MRVTGTYRSSTVAGETFEVFVPEPLPPRDPALKVDGETNELLHTARTAVAALEVAGDLVPSVEWFIYGFVRKEAVMSAQIEGTEATLDDLLASEADAGHDVGADDVSDVTNYIAALEYALGELRGDGLPVSVRLLRETHRRLLAGVRGASKRPGEIRESQNWIGGTRPGNATFVPPPPDTVETLMGDLERYIHADADLPPLIRAGLVHVQFETIHPFLDGNGRLGRLLITLLLEDWGILSRPLLYPSAFLKRHRSEYYGRLGAVRTRGDWEGWTRFFLEGVATVARDASDSARDLSAIVAGDRQKLLASSEATFTAMKLFEELPEQPVITVTRAMKLIETSRPTATKTVGILESAGFLNERTGRGRDRVWEYTDYLDRLRVE